MKKIIKVEKLIMIKNIFFILSFLCCSVGSLYSGPGISVASGPDTAEISTSTDDLDSDKSIPLVDEKPVTLSLKDFKDLLEKLDNRLESTGTPKNNFKNLSSALQKEEYKSIEMVPHNDTETLEIVLKNSAKTDTKKVVSLTKQETELLHTSIAKLQEKKAEQEEENSEKDKDDALEKRRYLAGLDKDKANKEKTETQKNKPQPLRQQMPQRRMMARRPQPRYNRYNPYGYQGRYGNSFRPDPIEVKTAKVVEGAAPKSVPDAQEKDKVNPHNVVFKRKTDSRVPSAQKSSVKRITPSYQNYEHKKRTQKISPKFTGIILQEKPEEVKRPKTKTMNSADNKEDTSVLQSIKNSFYSLWESVTNLISY